MLEQAICDHLQKCEGLRPYLATYDGHMAVFIRKPPGINDSKWGEGSKYGRIVLSLNLRDDPERKSVSTLNVDIICEKEQQSIEDIESVIKENTNGWFFATDNLTISADWLLTKPLAVSDDTSLAGIRLKFAVGQYAKSTNVEDNPVTLFNRWTKEKLPELLGQNPYLIGDEQLPSAFRPSGSKTAIYWRLDSTGSCNWIKDNHTADWRTDILKCHIMAGENKATEIDLARKIDTALIRARRIESQSLTVILGQKNTVNLTVGPKGIGQLSVEATYGLPHGQAASKKLQEISVKME